MWRKFINHFLIQSHIKISGWSSKRFDAAGAFRATQIAVGGWLNRNCKWQAPLDWFSGVFADVKRRSYGKGIRNFSKRKFLQKVENVFMIQEEMFAAKLFSCILTFVLLLFLCLFHISL